MKISQPQLSTFQKQQYTLYLQTQLQKFSTFMLTQKKDNQRHHHLESIIEKISKDIEVIGERVRILEFYQKENFKQCEKLRDQGEKTMELEGRLKKVQSMYFQRPIQGKNKENNHQLANVGKIYHDQLRHLEKHIQTLHKETSKKIKNIEKQLQNLVSQTIEKAYITKRESQPLQTNYSQVSSAHNSYTPQAHGVTKGELKATENKIYHVFQQKFSKIEEMIRKSLRKSSRKASKLSEENYGQILIKEQTFGEQYSSNNSTSRMNERKNQIYHENLQTINHDIVGRNEKSFTDKSYIISDTSQRLKPMNSRISGVEEPKKSMKKKKQTRKSKDLGHKQHQSNSRSVSKSKSASASRSKSKSVKNQQQGHVRSVRQFEHKHPLSPYNQKQLPKRQKKSVSKSVSKSRSKSEKNSKVSASKSPQNHKAKPKLKPKQKYNYEGKQYLMHCQKNHYHSHA